MLLEQHMFLQAKVVMVQFYCFAYVIFNGEKCIDDQFLLHLVDLSSLKVKQTSICFFLSHSSHTFTSWWTPKIQKKTSWPLQLYHIMFKGLIPQIKGKKAFLHFKKLNAKITLLQETHFMKDNHLFLHKAFNQSLYTSTSTKTKRVAIFIHQSFSLEVQ